ACNDNWRGAIWRQTTSPGAWVLVAQRRDGRVRSREASHKPPTTSIMVTKRAPPAGRATPRRQPPQPSPQPGEGGEGARRVKVPVPSSLRLTEKFWCSSVGTACTGSVRNHCFSEGR